MQHLWGALQTWEQLGSALTGGSVVPEWVKAQGLDKSVPEEQLSVIVSRLEPVYYGLKLWWVKAQMEHARGATQAQQVSASTAPKWSFPHERGAARRLQSNAQKPRCLGTSKQNAPSLRLAVSGTVSTC